MAPTKLAPLTLALFNNISIALSVKLSINVS